MVTQKELLWEITSSLDLVDDPAQICLGAENRCNGEGDCDDWADESAHLCHNCTQPNLFRWTTMTMVRITRYLLNVIDEN